MGKIKFKKLYLFPALDQNITYLELTVDAADDDDLDKQCNNCLLSSVLNILVFYHHLSFLHAKN